MLRTVNMLILKQLNHLQQSQATTLQMFTWQKTVNQSHQVPVNSLQLQHADVELTIQVIENNTENKLMLRNNKITKNCDDMLVIYNYMVVNSRQ